jgi:hypothetical protein
LTKMYEKKDMDAPNDHYGLEVLDAVRNAFYTAMNIKDSKRIQKSRIEIIKLINNYNPQSSSLFRLRLDLIELMLANPNVFQNDDFSGMNDICFNFGQTANDMHLAIAMYEEGEKIEQKLKISTRNWRHLIAEAYEQMMIANQEKNKMVSLYFCQNALKYYRQINNINKIAELERVYNELKGATEFKKIEYKIDLEPYVKECETKAKKLVEKLTSDQILMLLATGENIVPKLSEMRKIAIDLLNEHPLQKVFPIELFDERGHTAEHFVTEEEIIFFKTRSIQDVFRDTTHYLD